MKTLTTVQSLFTYYKSGLKDYITNKLKGLTVVSDLHYHIEIIELITKIVQFKFNFF